MSLRKQLTKIQKGIDNLQKSIQQLYKEQEKQESESWIYLSRLLKKSNF
jgi:peptidoglycan hydrolase CwlO-like protein